MLARPLFAGLMMVVLSGIVGCQPDLQEGPETAQVTSELTLVCSALSASTCARTVGCEYLAGCCGGMCVDRFQTCPIECPPPEGEQSALPEATCDGLSSSICGATAGCEYLKGCCGGMCVEQGQTCPIVCPPPEG
jgi:hypothetical protein